MQNKKSKTIISALAEVPFEDLEDLDAPIPKTKRKNKEKASLSSRNMEKEETLPTSNSKKKSKKEESYLPISTTTSSNRLVEVVDDEELVDYDEEVIAPNQSECVPNSNSEVENGNEYLEESDSESSEEESSLLLDFLEKFDIILIVAIKLINEALQIATDCSLLWYPRNPLMLDVAAWVLPRKHDTLATLLIKKELHRILHEICSLDKKEYFVVRDNLTKSIIQDPETSLQYCMNELIDLEVKLNHRPSPVHGNYATIKYTIPKKG